MDTSKRYIIRNKATQDALFEAHGRIGATFVYSNNVGAQFWKFVPIKGVPKTYAIVNAISGNALDHYRTKSVAVAKNSDLVNSHHHWKLVNIESHYAILNRESGHALDHYEGKSIQAYNSDISSLYHQWTIVPVSK
eukprot:Awhi_evm1s1439